MTSSCCINREISKIQDLMICFRPYVPVGTDEKEGEEIYYLFLYYSQ